MTRLFLMILLLTLVAAQASAAGVVETIETPAASSTRDWYTIVTDWQNAITGVLGFAGIIIAAVIGFHGIKHAQLTNGRLARERDAELRNQEAKALAAALSGELYTIARYSRAHLGLIDSRIEWWKKQADEKGIPHEQYEIKSRIIGLYPVIETPIFEANASRLGLLGPSLAAELAFIYQTISIWRRLETLQPYRTLATYIKSISGVTEDVEGFENVAERLRAFDPAKAERQA